MNRKILLFLAIFLALPPLALSIRTFVVQETEKLHLAVNATDVGGNPLTITYTKPLNSEGEWQTAYGDAGEYMATVTVSNGAFNSSEDIMIMVNKKEEAPVIDSYAPEQEALSIMETESINFSVSGNDLDKDKLSYSWLLDGRKVQDGQAFTYITNYNDAGAHNITAIVSDGKTQASREWDVNVGKIDVQSLLDNIPDVNVNENEVARLKLPDFAKYGLSYSISEPIGGKNEWHTTYDNNGTYEVEVHAEGRGFSGTKIVKVVVNDVDRAPVFQPIGNRVISENEELDIVLNATDPDGDEIAYSASNMPEGATLEGNVFRWKPDYGVVRKEGFVDSLINRFGVLSRSFYVQFAASARDKKVVQNVVITVKHTDRAPVIDDIEPITINEGDTLRISPNAYDPDGDEVKLSYSGLADKSTYKSSFGDAGTYNVKVTASDGYLETSKFVQVNIMHVNRAPVFDKISGIKAKEGDKVAIALSAHDPDNDNISYSIDNPPEGSSLNGNIFLWDIGYGIVGKGEIRQFELVFAASDGKAETRQAAKAEVAYRNRAPRIVNATKSVVAYVGKPVLMYVNAVDDDGDDLTYTWDFGLFEKYKATPLHQRIFTSAGSKTVRVIVSDGTDATEQTINVNVI